LHREPSEDGSYTEDGYLKDNFVVDDVDELVEATASLKIKKKVIHISDDDD